MGKVFASILFATIFASLLAPVADAQVPQHLNHQGILTNNAGVIVPDGLYELEFQIYDTPSTSGTLRFEQSLTVNVVNGLYNVLLSDNAGGTLANAFDGATRYLQLRIVTSPGGTYNDLVLSPRQQIASVPYALVAGRVVDEGVPPPITSLVCRDTDADPVAENRYVQTAWTDARVLCSITVPGEGYVVRVAGSLFADNDSGTNYILGRIRETCGGVTNTVATGIALAGANNETEESDLAYLPMMFTRMETQSGQTCTYAIEGRSAYSGQTFDTNGGDSNDTDDLPEPVATWIEAVAVTVR